MTYSESNMGLYQWRFRNLDLEQLMYYYVGGGLDNVFEDYYTQSMAFRKIYSQKKNQTLYFKIIRENTFYPVIFLLLENIVILVHLPFPLLG